MDNPAWIFRFIVAQMKFWHRSHFLYTSSSAGGRGLSSWNATFWQFPKQRVAISGIAIAISNIAYSEGR